MTSSMDGAVREFRVKVRELSVQAYSEHEDARFRLNSILDCLNALDYSVKFIEVEDGERALAQCCRVVPLPNHLLVSKFCQLIVNITFKQQITPSDGNYCLVMEYLIQSLRSAYNWLLVDLLRAMGSLLYQNGTQSEKFNSVLIGEERFLVTLALTAKDEDVRRSALQCLENMCMRGMDGSVMGEDDLRICCDTFLHVLYDRRDGMSELGYCRVVIAALKGLSNALYNQKNVMQDRLGEVLGAVKTFMLYNGEPVSVTPLFATLVSQQETKSAPKTTVTKSTDDSKRKKKKKKAKAEVNTEEPAQEVVNDVTETPSEEPTLSLQPSWRVSSESEFSDPEGGAASKLRTYLAKTRISALSCLMAVVRSSERRLVFGYWTHFLPDSSNRSAPAQNLFTCILKERNHRCRLAALSALSSLLEGSKQFLVAADDSDQTRTAFTAYSSTLGSMVKELHVNLLHALIAEQMPLPITHIIKCLGVLIENTNYQKLKPGLLTRVVKQVKPFLTHRDTNIRVACLTCMGAVLSVQAPMIEVSYILESDRNAAGGDTTPERLEPAFPHSPSHMHSPSNRTPFQSRSGFMTPTEAPPNVNWLLVKCLRNINFKLLQPDSERVYEPLPVRLESLQVLTRLVQGYFTCVKQNFGLLQEVVIDCFNATEPPLQLHGAKLLEALGNVMSPHPSAVVPQPTASVPHEQAAEFWTKVLSGPLSSVLQNCNTNVVRAAGCDCLSTIGADIFALFPLHLRTLCMTLLLGFTMDPDHVTRSSAVRTLGVYVMYPCLRDDVSFVADVANSVLVLLKDSSAIVRTKAAWSLGNVSDAMCANKDANNDDFLTDFSDLLLLKMLQGALKSTQDNYDKVRIHSVRALGNILRYMPARPMEKPNMNDLITQAVQTLVKNVGTGAMKVRWNACYALGSVLKNEILPIGRADWTPAIFSSLSIAVRDCKNFKVRINAALALNQITNRKQLLCSDDQIATIWSSLIKSLQSLDTVTDFADFKLRDRLPDQVCCSLVHLTQFLELEDLPQISKTISSNQLLLMDCMGKFWARLQEEPQRAEAVERAQGRLAQLNVTCEDEYKLITIQNLISVFTRPEVATSEVPVDDESGLSWKTWTMASAQSAFRDTYD